MFFLRRPLLPIALVVIFCRGETLFAQIKSRDALLYEEKLNVVNEQIDSMRADDSSCPISSLVRSCGDEICESPAENRENCKADCIVAPIKSYDRQIACEEVEQVFAPTAISQIRTLVNHARRDNMRVRVVGSRHSVNQQYCNDGLVINMENFNRIIGIEENGNGDKSVVVEAGVTLGDLAEYLHERGFSLGYGQLGFRLATVGGAIATGAHGSSHKHSSVIASNVRSLTIITADGVEKEITESNADLLRALRAHLGMFGVVVKVKLKIVPQFNLHAQVTYHDDEELFAQNGLHNAIENCDYSFISWFPTKGRYIKGCAEETGERVDKNAENTLLNPGVPPGLVLPYKVAVHFGMCSEKLNADLEELRYLLLKWQPPFLKRRFFGVGPIGHTDDVVGYSHRIMSSKFIEVESGFFQNDWEIALPMSKAHLALRALREFISEHGLHFPIFGIFLRFAPSEDKTLLAHTTSIGNFRKNEPIVLVEIITPEAIGFPKQFKNAIDAPYHDLVKMLILDFTGRPHFGKNQEWTFSLRSPRDSYQRNLDSFRRIATYLDPQQMFTSDFAVRTGIIEEKK